MQLNKISNSQKGISLVEIIVVIFIIAIFSTILISDFPTIQRQFALSRAAYKLAEDLRRAQDLSLSGVKTNDSSGQPIAKVYGYGVYFNLSVPTQYIIYADVGNFQRYISGDPIIETTDISKDNPSLYIKQINNINGAYVSINFSPPDPTIKIDNLSSGNSEIGIVLGLNSDSSAIRTVWANTSGLINVQ